MQTAERRTVAGASETAGSLVFRPRERPPTQLHQAPSRLQRCAPSRLSTISGAAEPKSLSRLPSNNGEMERANTPPSSPGHCTFTRVRATIPRPKLRVGRHSSFASVLYQPKFPERIHGLFDCHHGDPQPPACIVDIPLVQVLFFLFGYELGAIGHCSACSRYLMSRIVGCPGLRSEELDERTFYLSSDGYCVACQTQPKLKPRT